MPPFLIIDTPRKNFGTLPDDRALTERLYRLLLTLQDASRQGASRERLQLIVADNDVPPIASELHAIRFSYEEPFVRDLPHPGEGLVDTIAGGEAN